MKKILRYIDGELSRVDKLCEDLETQLEGHRKTVVDIQEKSKK